MDSFQTLNTWQNYNKILEMCNIIVVNRPSYEIPDTSWSHELLQNHLASSKEEFLQHNYGKIFMISMPPQDVSATQIRNTLKQKSGDLINLPTKVKEYIDQNNLYKIRGSNHSTMDIKKIEQILDDQKAEDINVIDVRNLTSLTDYMIICTARSTRHAAAIGENLAEEMAKSGLKPIGVEGDSQSDWILLDFADFIVHVMLAEARDFYSLEKLWSLTTSARERAERDA
jgi:ribosome-associated protein